MNGAKIRGAIIGVLGVVAACGSDDTASLSVGGPSGTGNSGGTSPLPPGSGAEEPEPPPEQELEPAFRVPVVSGHWVWTANPLSGRVALIDAKTFTVKTALAGAGPTYLTALPAEAGGSRALVINAQSNDATLLAAGDDGEVEVLSTVPVHQGANAWAVTRDGRFAVAWTDASAVANADASEGFQDVTVLDLKTKVPSSKRLSVGYRPARVFVDDDSRYVYVVTDAGIDVIALDSDDGAEVEREVALSVDPANDTAAREVNVTPNGEYAFVRRDGKSYVTAVSLQLGTFVDVQLPGPVTDLDLSADASLAVAVIRDGAVAAGLEAAAVGAGGEAGRAGAGAGGDGAVGNEGGAVGAGGEGGLGVGGGAGDGPGPAPTGGSMVALLPVASIFTDPTSFQSVELDELFGSVELGRDGDTALLFSNGLPTTRLTLLGLAEAREGESRTVELKVPVFGATPTPDGAHAIALLRPAAGSKNPGAFAVVPVAKNLPPKIQGTVAVTVPEDLTKAAPAMVAVGNERALVTVTNGSEVNVSYLIRLPQLTVDAFPLDSVPLPRSSGLVLEANQAFVAQRHPEGRITFIDLETKEQHTLTGFELSTGVRQ